MANRKARQVGKCLTLAMVFAALTVPALPQSALAKDQTRDRKKDGTCKSLVVPAPAVDLTLAKAKKRDRKRDGSCQSLVTPAPSTDMTLAKDRKRDRKRDGSC